MNKEELINIAKNFKIAGEPINIEKCESGHINKTYAITYKTEKGENKKYILQYVNTNVFPNLPELMKNIKNVTSFMEEKAQEKGETTSRLTIKMIDTIDNNPYAIYNQNWRMEEFIDNTKTYLTTENLSILEEAGKAAGKFQKHLHGFPAEELYEIIPKFHYTPNRVNQLNEALTSKANLEQRKERFELAKDVIKFVTDEKRLNKTNIITNKLENKEIPLRVTHNDTKLSNILFDKDTDKAVCLIDLDTVMPGALAYDFGEGLRTGITTAKEDEQDLSKIKIDIDRFESYAKGFLSEVKETITKEELETLTLRSVDDDI
ncbi:MAG: phosphotransferase [Clostridia bacterium]|nr:phosphotransferase [Clostridia bacterium]